MRDPCSRVRRFAGPLQFDCETMSDDPGITTPNRCRLVLVMPPLADAERLLGEALEGGDVASVIFAPGDLDPDAYQAVCERLVPIAQGRSVAALVCDDTRVMGRCGADGIFLRRAGEALKETVARFSPHKIVGCGGARDRHLALEIGDRAPDFIFFGKLDGDIRPEPHRKNLALAEWWSSMIEIPCVVMGGSAIESVVDCAVAGAEFVALGLGVFSFTDGPGAGVEQANRLLDEHAPILEDG